MGKWSESRWDACSEGTEYTWILALLQSITPKECLKNNSEVFLWMFVGSFL